MDLVESLRLIPPVLYYLILYVAFTAEGTSFPFIHVPAIVMFLVSSYLASIGMVSVPLAIAAATLGSTTGGFITYKLGGRMSRRDEGVSPGAHGQLGTDDRPARARGRFRTAPERLDRAFALVSRYGALLALAARWLGVLRPAALLGTGMAGVSAAKVGPALLVGSLAYCAFYQMVALRLGTLALRLLGQVSLATVLLTILGLTLAWAAALYFLGRIRL